MTRSTSTNFTGANSFPKASVDSDPFLAEDIQQLATAVDGHDHSTGKGLAISRTVTYLGASTPGASVAMWAGGTVYAKSVTVTAACLGVGIEVYLKGNGAQAAGISPVIYADNAGTPGNIYSLVPFQRAEYYVWFSATPHWVTLPITTWLPAGTYWIGAYSQYGNPIGDCVNIYYDTGTDKSAVPPGGGGQGDTAFFTWSTTSRNHSIRLLTLT